MCMEGGVCTSLLQVMMADLLHIRTYHLPSKEAACSAITPCCRLSGVYANTRNYIKHAIAQ